MSYRVTWEIDIDDADSPVEAARKAMEYLTREGSIAHVFDVYGPRLPNSGVTVDLDALDGVPDAPPVGHYDRSPATETKED